MNCRWWAANLASYVKVYASTEADEIEVAPRIVHSHGSAIVVLNLVVSKLLVRINSEHFVRLMA
jgi:hypothetical protein